MATDSGSDLKTWVQRDFGLDKRLVKAVSKLGFVYPTQVQSQFIPIALQGKDVLVRSHTGSGKTAAFSLPVLQKILLAKSSGAASAASIKAVILAPTKELCRQIEKHITDLMYYCRDIVSVCSLGDDNASTVTYKLQSRPDVLVATPAKLVQQLKSSVVDISGVDTLVIDEADLVLSFGYAEDVQLITSRMPKVFQGLLMSATLSPELDKFKRVVLHNPAVLKISDSKSTGQLLQFYLESTESDKYLILYVFIKLGLLQGKGLIFVNDVSKCYRLKLFLQQFYIPAAVLNSEVPLNSRLHILEEYNRGVFDYLIATDASIDSGEIDESDGEAGSDSESGSEAESEGPGKEDSGSDASADEEEEEEEKAGGSKRRSPAVDPAAAAASVAAAQSKKGEGYGVSRGIDFQGVNFVINFDLPKTAAAYTHRIGRTARGGASGTALSFVALAPPSVSASEAEVASRDAEVLHAVQLSQPRLGAGNDGAGSVLAAIGAVPVHDPAMAAMHQGNDVDLSNCQPAPLVFNMKELDSFRYRVEETLRSVTTVAVREFRAAELKQEILNSAKLKSYFAENPDDLKVLRHDTAIAHPIRPKEHLRNVPSYLIPASMRGAATVTNNKKKKRKPGSAMNSQDAKRQKSKSNDPLQSFDANGGEGAPEGVATATAEPKVFTSNEALGHSISGRQEWKQRHKKGKFNPKNNKSGKMPGTFSTKRGFKK